jgi:hypothetical protein
MGRACSTHRENEISCIFHEISSFHRDRYLAAATTTMMMIGPSRHSRILVTFNHFSQHNSPEPKGPRVGLRIILKEVVDIL